MKRTIQSSARSFHRTWQRFHNSSPNCSQDNPHQMRGTMPTIWTNPVWTEALNESHRKAEKCRRNVISERFFSPVSQDCVITRLRKSRDCSTHLVKYFKKLLAGTDNELSWPGHVSMTFSIAVRDCYPNADFLSKAEEPAQNTKQVQLADAVNRLHNSHLFNLEHIRTSTIQTPKLTRAVQLVNNYFSSEALRKIGSLKHPEVTWLLGSILESTARTRWDSITGNDLHTLDAWEAACFNENGSIMANGCQASLSLANHPENIRHLGFQFGRLITLAIKAHCEIQKFIDYDKSVTSSYELNLLPVVMHIERNPETLAYIYSCAQPITNIELQELYEKMKPKAILDAKQQLKTYTDMLVAIVGEFKKSVSAQRLLQLICTLDKFDETN